MPDEDAAPTLVPEPEPGEDPTASTIQESPPYPQAPIVKREEALIVLLINLFVPGVGTIAAGIMGDKPLIGRGIAQLVLALIIVGWIWALITSLQTLQNSTWADKRGIEV